MKEKLLKIGIIATLLVLVYATIVNALSFSVTMTPTSTNVEESKEFIVKIAVANIDAGSNGINTLSGTLKYDTSVFEELNNSSIEGLNSWSTNYNEETGKITLTKTTFVKSDELVFQVTFKVKEEVSEPTGSIQFVNIVASNSESEINASDTSTTITIGTGDGNTANESNTNSNTNALVIRPVNSTVENREEENTTPTNNTTNNTSRYTIVNNSVSEEMPKTGVEDTVFYLIIGLIIIAIVFYIKFEKINKEIK